MIDVKCKVTTYEESATKEVVVESHWNNERFVVLHIGTKTVTVGANDILAAIKNATNSNRFS